MRNRLSSRQYIESMMVIQSPSIHRIHSLDALISFVHDHSLPTSKGILGAADTIQK